MTDTDTQAARETETKRLRARVQSLERHVESLESLFLGAVTLLTAVLLGVGSVLTIAVNPEWEAQSWGVLSAPIVLWGTLDNAENVGFALVMVLLSALFAVAVLVTLIFCASISRRDAGPRMVAFAKVLVAIVGIGVPGHLLLGLAAASADDGGPGAALFYLVPGAGLFALLTYWDPLRRLWAG